MGNDTTRLLGLDGLAVTAVENTTEDTIGGGLIVCLATADERARSCPACGVVAVRVKEWVTTQPRDLPVSGRAVRLRWRKRRWICDQTTCPRGTFTEWLDQVPARARITTRLRAAAGAAVGDGGRTIVQSARDHGLSWPVVADAFAAHAARVLPDQPDPVAVLGLMRPVGVARSGSTTTNWACGSSPWIAGTSGSSISLGHKDYWVRLKVVPRGR